MTRSDRVRHSAAAADYRLQTEAYPDHHQPEVQEMLRQFPFTLLLLGCAAANAQTDSKILVATGKEVHVAMLEAGATICEGGQPATQGPPCSAGTKRIWIWNRVNELEYQDVTGSAAAFLKGKNVTIVHCNLDENYYGHCFGSFEWTIPEKGGRWEGVWSTSSDMMNGIVVNSVSGYGYGGGLEGLQLKFEAVNPGRLPHSVFIARVSKK